mgnify:CR=1 FL=1
MTLRFLMIPIELSLKGDNMNILDKAIAWISPQAAYKRMAYRDALELQRAYDAANYRGANQNWYAFNEPAEMEISPSRELIRARARSGEQFRYYEFHSGGI